MDSCEVRTAVCPPQWGKAVTLVLRGMLLGEWRWCPQKTMRQVEGQRVEKLELEKNATVKGKC